MAFLIGASEQSIYPIAPVRDGIVFPGTENVLVFGRPKSVGAIQEALKKDKKIVLLMQKNPIIDDPAVEDLYQVGVLASIEKTAAGERGEINALVRGLEKVKVIAFTDEKNWFQAKVQAAKDDKTIDEETEAMVKHISTQIKRAINLGKTVDFVFLMNILNTTDFQSFSNQIAVVLDLKPEERQALLQEIKLKERLRKEVEFVNREIKILEIEHSLTSKTQKKFEQGMRENILREKMKTIEEELGEKGEDKDLTGYQEKIKKAKMPKEVEEKANKELKRLRQMSQFNPESSYVRTYLDWLIELPWSVSSPNNINIKEAEKILNDEHFGLKKIKERILEYLAVLELRKIKKNEKSKQPTILCFVGPPGVGKTSLGRSIAHALGRKFVKMSLGGIRDEAEIRGHRRTYVGALPGRIIQGVKQAATKNPVFMLDEIDKIGRDYRGDPSSALLEALDPEQNHAFSDHYLEVDFNLSDVFFITTANILDTIPDALLDRLEIIHFPGYTEDEKYNIAKSHLIKKQLEVHSLTDKEINITESSLKTIIRRYTREAGVRELERQIGTIMRKVTRNIVEKKYASKTVGLSDLSKLLGPFKYSSQMIEEKDTIGISTGLAWTQAGGDILFIEVAIMPGKGGLTLTGHLGEVMKESCQAALSYIRARYKKFGLKDDFFNKIDIHVHVPEGAVPKDGPSAGLAISTAMISALTKTPTDRSVAMTGEITLRGRALEIGGVKEKVIAAHRAGIKTVIMPKDNKKDLEDIPGYVLKALDFVYVEHMDQVLRVALKEK
ncbi:MAG: Lon protease [Candidatus Roizmanbacteria bacterium GW2011_GWC2_37_13]|uniref:Lon protease n=1 Tax=Candidatus Roizmanbacteria bacterium GW2011_GWC2_37_13 TaxID=1618486 RepID=A0A0G0G949_9BACT|nr:MAG: Lon protease [Candidatus Roizmanbacteria bacterium GW2011_GWC1_37_12]KKQ26542.1 MAG: Lon protease [Candidatus Roizmanbacteria bacterium GW2011_GWC2_37_13]